MPINTKRSQKKADSLAFLDDFGESKKEFIIVDDLLYQYESLFLENLAKNYNQKVKASGNLLRKTKVTVNEEDGKRVLTISIPRYYDYPNEGVRGWGDSSNSPNSPYKFKTKGMNVAGRKSIKEYIQSGKAKVTNQTVIRKRPLGGEKKSISLIDAQVNKLVYLIKKYGIKTTRYFDDAFEDSFKDLENNMANGIAYEIKIRLTGKKTIE